MKSGVSAMYLRPVQFRHITHWVRLYWRLEMNCCAPLRQFLLRGARLGTFEVDPHHNIFEKDVE
jgi:hypothetical protein